jgi:hypothetical protein
MRSSEPSTVYIAVYLVNRADDSPYPQEHYLSSRSTAIGIDAPRASSGASSRYLQSWSQFAALRDADEYAPPSER